MTDTPEDEAPNEIIDAVKAHARVAEQAVKQKAKSWPLGRIGMGAAIGSAAVAAAVLFARKRDD